MFIVGIVGSFGVLTSLVLTKLLINSAQKIGMVDLPNHRSSHVIPTPKGGGLVFSIAFTLCGLGVYIFDDRFKLMSSVLLVGGPIVVAIGWLDDRYKLSATLRLAVHFYVAICVIGLVTSWYQDSIQLLFLPNIAILNYIFCLLFISWFINLYNFMDGSDGMAGLTGVVGSIALAIISYMYGADRLGLAYILVACSLMGFLYYNWHPAKVFMGDSGSYFLGFCFASLALIGQVESGISLYPTVIIFGFFIVDATMTLVVRAMRKQNVYQAHNEFAFHKMIKKGWSHKATALLYALVVIFWLFPWAYLSMQYPIYAFFMVALSYLPLIIFAQYHKVGRP